MATDGRIPVFALKRIDAAYIHEKGFEDARRAKDLLWATKVRRGKKVCEGEPSADVLRLQFNEARAEKRADNMWSLMRAAETEVSRSRQEYHFHAHRPRRSCGSS